MSISKENPKVILFDGVCNLCNNSVKFIIKNDKRNIFKFAPLQGKYGIKIQNRYNINTTEINSIILYFLKIDKEMLITQNFIKQYSVEENPNLNGSKTANLGPPKLSPFKT